MDTPRKKTRCAMVGKRRIDRTKMTDIRQQLNLKHRRFNWFGHVIRRGENSRMGYKYFQKKQSVGT